MRPFRSFALLLVLFNVPAAAIAEPQRYQLDPAHATVAFLIEHVGFARTLGSFDEVSGTFSYDQEAGVLRDLQVVVRTASVSTRHEARDKHVRSKDFLNVSAHQHMTFTATGETPVVDGKASITGDLALLGKSRPLTLEATLNKAGKYPFGHKLFTLGVSASGSLERSEFGMYYAVASALVGDTVELIIEIEANRK